MNAALRRIGLGLFVATASFASLLMRGDAPPPDDADLMQLPALVPDSQNGFISLCAAGELVRWPEDEAESARWSRLARGEEWDDALAAAALAANARALEAMGRAARLEAFQSPPIRDLAADVPEMLPWLQLAQLSAMRSLSAARDADAALAAEAGLLPLQIAQRVSGNPNGALLSGMSGLGIGAAGIDALERALPAIAPAPDVARELGAKLATLRTAPDAWRAMWASEYRTERPLRVSADAATLLGERPSMRWLASVLPASYLYQPNKSLAAYATRIRARQASAGAACTSADSASSGVWNLSLLLPNGAGRLAATGEALARFDVRRCLYDTRVEMLRGAVALLAFERERGSLPPALEALVPAYLETAPRDWFATDSLRLDRRGRLIYSVGSDGVDERGQDRGAERGDDAEALEPRLVVPALAPAR